MDLERLPPDKSRKHRYRFLTRGSSGYEERERGTFVDLSFSCHPYFVETRQDSFTTQPRSRAAHNASGQIFHLSLGHQDNCWIQFSISKWCLLHSPQGFPSSFVCLHTLCELSFQSKNPAHSFFWAPSLTSTLLDFPFWSLGCACRCSCIHTNGSFRLYLSST